MPENYLVVGGNAYWLDEDADLMGAPVNADDTLDMDNAGPIGEEFDADAERVRLAVAAAIAAAAAFAALY